MLDLTLPISRQCSIPIPPENARFHLRNLGGHRSPVLLLQRKSQASTSQSYFSTFYKAYFHRKLVGFAFSKPYFEYE